MIVKDFLPFTVIYLQEYLKMKSNAEIGISSNFKCWCSLLLLIVMDLFKNVWICC